MIKIWCGGRTRVKKFRVITESGPSRGFQKFRVVSQSGPSNGFQKFRVMSQSGPSNGFQWWSSYSLLITTYSSYPKPKAAEPQSNEAIRLQNQKASKTKAKTFKVARLARRDVRST